MPRNEPPEPPPPPLPAIALPVVCANCGRAEPRPSVRICPNCGAVLPGAANARVAASGFAALAQCERVSEQTLESGAETNPEGGNPPESAPGEPVSQPWALDRTGLTAADQGKPVRRTAAGVLGGCLAAMGVTAAVIGGIVLLLILGILVLCSGVIKP